MQRVEIVVKGKVQKVGYRDVVQEIARKFGIVGYVENLEDGDVKIVAEGEEEILRNFAEAIKMKKDFIEVRETKVSFKPTTGEFKLFKIKYGDIQEELGERMGAAILYINKTNEKIDSGNEKLLEGQDKMLDKQDQTIGVIKEGNEKLLEGQDKMLDKQDQMSVKQDKMLDKQDQTIGAIKEGTEEMRESREENKTILKDFHQETIQRFDMVDVKYGKIAENMEKILQEMKEERREFRESIERLIKTSLERK